MVSTKQSYQDSITKAEFVKQIKMPGPCHVVWDIETGPLPHDQLLRFFDENKVKLPRHPGNFDATKVNYGVRKDPVKRASWLKDCQGRHSKKLLEYEEKCANARQEAVEALHSKAPLSAWTNQVLAIGYGVLQEDGSIKIFLHLDKEEALVKGWAFVMRSVQETLGENYTFNGSNFDIPVMTAKCWKYDVDMPYLLTKYNKMEDCCVDAMRYFQMGNNPMNRPSLKNASKFLGVEGKLEGMDGSMFADVLRADVERAKNYLWHDIDSLYRVLTKLGLLDSPQSRLKAFSKSRRAYEAKEGKK